MFHISLPGHSGFYPSEFKREFERYYLGAMLRVNPPEWCETVEPGFWDMVADLFTDK